jgi:hypothetical protein
MPALTPESASSTDKRVMRLSVVVLAFVCISSGVSAQRYFVLQHRPNGRVVGLLDLPDVTENFADGDACKSTELIGAQLYDNPSRAGAAIGAVYKRHHPEYGCGLLFKRAETSTEEELPTSESGYEIAAAVVYERRGRWFRIAVSQGSAWIERANLQDFLPYPQLLSQRMAFLRTDWDGQLRQMAGARFPTQPLPVEWKERVPQGIGIQVLGMTRVGNDDWIHVEFTTERCGDDTIKTLKPVQGWLPAYRSDGGPTAWFYSRGC